MEALEQAGSIGHAAGDQRRNPDQSWSNIYTERTKYFYHTNKTLYEIGSSGLSPCLL